MTMPSIADQVETLEHDHVAALAQIDALTSANAALASANTTLNAENASLRDQVADMQKYVDSTRSMAELIARSTLDMLRASRCPVGAPAEVIPFLGRVQTPEEPTVLPSGDGLVSKQDASSSLVGADQNDSGDEQPNTTQADLDEQDAGNANALGSQEPETSIKQLRADDLTTEQLSDHVADLAIANGILLSPAEKSDVVVGALFINAKITPLPINKPWPMKPVMLAPMLVEHDGDLPIFLQRDTPFGPREPAQVFG